MAAHGARIVKRAGEREEREPRKRILPAGKLLRVEKKSVLSSELMDRLTLLSRLPSDFRFLARHAPSRAAAQRLLERARGTDAEEDVQRLLLLRKKT